MKTLTTLSVIFAIGLFCIVGTAQAIPVLNVDLNSGALSITFDAGTSVSSLGITDLGGGNGLVALNTTSSTVIGMGAIQAANDSSTYQELRAMGALSLSGTIAVPNTSVNPAIILGYDSLAGLNADGAKAAGSRSYLDFNALPGVGAESAVVYSFIPEPSTLIMAGLSLAMLGFVARRQRNRG